MLEANLRPSAWGGHGCGGDGVGLTGQCGATGAGIHGDGSPGATQVPSCCHPAPNLHLLSPFPPSHCLPGRGRGPVRAASRGLRAGHVRRRGYFARLVTRRHVVFPRAVF